MESYGKELILDIHDCDISKFNRDAINYYLVVLCSKIDMDMEDCYFWDYEDDLKEKEKAPPYLKGTSCVQFISTSTIVIHTLDDLKKVFINIFSCKDFDTKSIRHLTESFFGGKVYNSQEIIRE